MSFEHGSISFRICRLPQDMPTDAVERFAAQAASGLDQVLDEPAWGWVSPRHLLDSKITDDTVRPAGYYHLCLRQAERKIPTSILNAECKMIELNRMAEKDSDHLNKKERSAIRKEVVERLLPTMPVQLSGIYFTIDPTEKLLYTTAVSQHQLDLFLGFFEKAVGFEPVPMTPETAAMLVCKTRAADIPLEAIAPNSKPSDETGTLGQNFLTWLWQYQEDNDGKLPPSKLGDFTIFINGPLTFVAERLDDTENPGAKELTIRKEGAPMFAAETKASLMVGKKLRRATITMTRDATEEWTFTLDADEFVFRSCKLPSGEELDPVSVFADRMTALYNLQTVFFALFKKFVDEMMDSAKRAAYVERAHAWISNREAK